MPVLANTKHELFARALAEGKGSLEAYVSVGYKPDPANASNLAHKSHIQARIQEITNFAQMRTEVAISVTLQSLIEEATEIQARAIDDEQYSAAVAALTAKAKLAGLWIERGEHANTNVNYAVGEQPITDEEWTEKHVTEH